MIMKRIFIVLMLCFCVSNYLYSQEQDTLINPYDASIAIMDVNNYDNDNIPDTLLGKAGVYDYMKPYKILWGDNTNGTNKYVTEFTYPDNSYLYYSTANLDRNEDNIEDLMFFITGKYLDANEKEVFISKVVTIFGQTALKYENQVSVMDLNITSSSPFYCEVMDDCSQLVSSNIENKETYGQFELAASNVVIRPQYKERIENELENIEITVSPNPAQQFCNIQINDFGSHLFDIEIVNTNGKILKAAQLKTNNASSTLKLSLDELSSGSYSIAVYCNNIQVDVLQLRIVK